MSAPAIVRSPRRLGAVARQLGPAAGAGVALAVLVVANAIFTPGFASAASAANILTQVATTALVAVGMTLVIATRGIDLSVGSVMAIAAAVAASLIGHGVALAVAAALGAALAAGLLNGAVVAAFRIQPIVVTLALLIGGRGIAQVMSDGQLIAFSAPDLEVLGRGHLGPVPVQVALVALIALAAGFVLRATRLGRHIVAVGGNEAAARLAGVKVARTKLWVYAASGLCAGLAGVIETARLGASDAAKVGLNMELDAIAAVVVGGTALAGGRATILGTLFGALLMQVITTSFNMLLVPYSWSLVFKAAIVIVAVAIQRGRQP